MSSWGSQSGIKAEEKKKGSGFSLWKDLLQAMHLDVVNVVMLYILSRYGYKGTAKIARFATYKGTSYAVSKLVYFFNLLPCVLCLEREEAPVEKGEATQEAPVEKGEATQ